MTTLTQAIGDLTKDGGPLDLGRDRSRLFVRLQRELAGGRPVSADDVTRLIADLELTSAEARDFLEQWTERDAEGNVVGLGITLNETPHRFTTNGVQVFAWCALDTLIFPTILNRTCHVESISPVSGATTKLEVTTEGVQSVSPAAAVISAPLIESRDVDVSSVEAIWGTFCHRSYFFPSRGEAEQWVLGKDKIGIASMDEGFELAHDLAARFLAYGL